MRFEDKATTKKGDLGENIVDNIMLEKGYIPYLPLKGTGAHPFDRLYATRDKETIFILDVKAKPQRTYYPDTGINLNNYNQYKSFMDKYKICVVLMFVDEKIATVYGGKITKLSAVKEIWHKGKILQYPLIDKGIIYFPIDSMETVANITPEEAQSLKDLSTRNIAYD